MPGKYLFFYNPISGTKSKEPLLRSIRDRCTKNNLVFEIAETDAKAQYPLLRQKILDDQITDVIVCGGDGTVNEITSSLLGCNVNIGIIPMGSGNGLALAAGIPTNTEKALDVICKGNSIETDGFFINQHFSCMLCGLGFDAQVAHDFAKQGRRGLFTYVLQTFKNFFSARAWSFSLNINGQKINTEAFFISIANSNQFGNNVTIAPKASLSDGLIDIVIVKEMSKGRLLYSLLKQIKMGQLTNTEKKYHKEDILYYQAKSVSIQNPSLAPLHIDGNPAATSEHFEIRIVEKAFRLLQP